MMSQLTNYCITADTVKSLIDTAEQQTIADKTNAVKTPNTIICQLEIYYPKIKQHRKSRNGWKNWHL